MNSMSPPVAEEAKASTPEPETRKREAPTSRAAADLALILSMLAPAPAEYHRAAQMFSWSDNCSIRDRDSGRLNDLADA
jgi:hypothetical protein